jgi:hypothetical protein
MQEGVGMSTVTLALAYLFWGVIAPAAVWESIIWLATKVPGYERRVFGVTHERP